MSFSFRFHHIDFQITINERDLSDARQSILNQLPSVLSSLLFIWKTISEVFIFETPTEHILSTNLPLQSSTNHPWPLQSVKQIRQTILDFLYSLTKSNGVTFISAVAQCWGERKRQQRTQQKTNPQTNNDTTSRTTILNMPRDNVGETQALIDIVMNLNGYTINDMISHMNELIRTQLTARDKVKKNSSNSFQSIRLFFFRLEKTKFRCLVSPVLIGVFSSSKNRFNRLLDNVSFHV